MSRSDPASYIRVASTSYESDEEQLQRRSRAGSIAGKSDGHGGGGDDRFAVACSTWQPGKEGQLLAPLSVLHQQAQQHQQAQPLQQPGTPKWWHSPAQWAARRRWCCGGRGLLAAAALVLLAMIAVHEAAERRQGGDQWGQGAAAASSTGRQVQVQQCELELVGSPLDQHCQRLERVCVDQGMLILYDDRYQQLDNRRAGALPKLLVDTSKLFEYPWRKTSSAPEPDDAADDGAAADDEADPGGGANQQAAAAEEAAAEAAAGGDGGGSPGGGTRRRLRYKVQEPSKTRHIALLPMRPATSEEPTPYLQEPQFSSCTVPVFLYASWRANFFHVFKDLSAVFYTLLRRTSWRAHAKLVSVTPDGLPLTVPEAALLPPLSGLSVQTMADFSSRLPPEYRPEADASQPPHSFEGGHRRCFQTAFFCGRNFPLGGGMPAEEEEAASQAQRAAALAETVPVEPYGWGQALSQHVQQQQQRQRQQQRGGRQAPPLPDAITMQASAVAAAEAPPLAALPPSAPRASTSGRLRILFMRRGSEGRQILNVADLLQRCNEWRYEPPGGGPPVTANCSEITVPDLESGVAAAREADVFVGMHGANLANGWMMRPGASVIELIPYQFETGRGAFVFSSTNARDATSQVLWWVGVLCDPSASTPGPSEIAGTGLQDWWPRDRNSRVPWGVLEAALARVVEAGGSRERYLKEYFGQGRHRLNFDADGVIEGGPRCPALDASGR